MKDRNIILQMVEDMTENPLCPESCGCREYYAEALYDEGYRKESELLKEIEQLKATVQIHLHDIDDLHAEREKRVEEVYTDFMTDYKIMREELNESQEREQALLRGMNNAQAKLETVAKEIAKETAKEIIKWIKLNGTFGYGGYVIHDSTIEQMCKKYGVEVENANTCVSCGDIIPEGRQVCPNCNK